MAALHPAIEFGSNTSSPRSYNDDTTSMQVQPPSVRLMCSFGGKILPRPFDNQLRYVGGDTRIIAVDRRTTFSSLVAKLSKLSGAANMCLKYQLPNEGLDALITVTTDEDVENMMEEYDRLAHITQKSARLRLFLFPNEADHSTPTSISSILDGSAKSEQWFIDALNCDPGPVLFERGRSEVSSVISDVPDYLFENLDERPSEIRLKNKKLLHDNISNSVPPTVTVMPDLPPVKTKPDKQDKTAPAIESKETPIESVTELGEKPVPQQQCGYPGSRFTHYSGPQVQPIPVYYVTGPFQQGSLPVQPMPIGAPCVQPFTVRQGQIAVGFSPAVSSIAQVQDGVRQAKALDSHERSPSVVTDGVNLPMFRGVRNAGIAPSHSGAAATGGEEMHGRPVLDGKVGRNPQAS